MDPLQAQPGEVEESFVQQRPAYQVAKIMTRRGLSEPNMFPATSLRMAPQPTQAARTEDLDRRYEDARSRIFEGPDRSGEPPARASRDKRRLPPRGSLVDGEEHEYRRNNAPYGMSPPQPPPSPSTEQYQQYGFLPHPQAVPQAPFGWPLPGMPFPGDGTLGQSILPAPPMPMLFPPFFGPPPPGGGSVFPPMMPIYPSPFMGFTSPTGR